MPDIPLNRAHANSGKPPLPEAKDGEPLLCGGADDAPTNSVDNIPGIDKIMTPLPLTEQLPAQTSQQDPAAVPEMANLAAWMPPRQSGAFHQAEDGARSFDSFFQGDGGPNSVNSHNDSFRVAPKLPQLAHRASDDAGRRASSTSHTSFASNSTLESSRASRGSLGAAPPSDAKVGLEAGLAVPGEPSGAPRRTPSRISSETTQLPNGLDSAPLKVDLSGISNTIPHNIPNGIPSGAPAVEGLEKSVLKAADNDPSLHNPAISAAAPASFNESFRAGIGRPLALESPGVFMPVPANIVFSPVTPYANQPILSPPIPVPGLAQPAIQIHHASPLSQQQSNSMAHQAHPNRPAAMPQRVVSTAANGLYLLSQDPNQNTAQGHAQSHGPSQPLSQAAAQVDQKSSKMKAPRTYSMGGSGRNPSRSRSGSKVGGLSPSHLPPASPVSSTKRPSAGNSSNTSDDLKLESDPKRPRSDSGSDNNGEGDEEERRKVFLERNRIAAIKCRQRKKQWVDELKSKADVYSQLNGELQRANHKLESNVEQLRQFVLAYHDMRSIPPNIAAILNAPMGHMQHDPSLTTSADPTAATINANWYTQQSHPPQQNQQLQHPPQPPQQLQQAPHIHQHAMQPPGHVSGDGMPDAYQDLAQQQNRHHQSRQQPGQVLR